MFYEGQEFDSFPEAEKTQNDYTKKTKFKIVKGGGPTLEGDDVLMFQWKEFKCEKSGVCQTKGGGTFRRE